MENSAGKEPLHSPSLSRLAAMTRDLNGLLREYMRKTWLTLQENVVGDPWNLIRIEEAFAKDLAVLVSLRDQLERVPYVGIYIQMYEGVKTPQIYLGNDEELDDTCNRTELMIAFERLGKYLSSVSGD